MKRKYEELNDFLIKGFMELGCDRKVAFEVAKSLLHAEFSGVPSHGLSMAIQHAKKIIRNEYNIGTRIIKEKETPAFSRYNCNNTIGMYSASVCMQLAIDKAKSVGMYTIYANNCNTFSAAFVYALQASKQGLIGFVMSNSPAQMAPIGGCARLLGTNPLSYAVPTKNEKNLIFDMATSIVAKSKINLAKEKNEEIPLGWALDEKGNPTTDPREAVKGLILPMAGAKGYGLAVMIDVFAGLLSGAQYLDGVGRFYNSTSSCMNVGHVFIAIDPTILYGDGFYEKMDNYIKRIRLSKSYNGNKIRLPGENKIDRYQKLILEGIEVPDMFFLEFNRVVNHG